MNDLKKVAKDAVAHILAEKKKWNQECSFLVISAVVEHLTGKEEPELKDAIWEILNFSGFRQKCEKHGLIAKSNGRGSAKVDSLLSDLNL